MEIGIADVQELALENFVLRRDLARAQQAIEELRRRLAQVESAKDKPEEGA